MNRVIQFYRAIFSRIDSDDLEFIKKYLDRDCELDLFFAQHPADQKHAVNVARMLGDDRFLIRCGLLHDVGRVKGDLDIFGKVFCVLAEKFPWLILTRSLEKNFYIYKHHAEIGAEKLRSIGLNREAEIISKHHSPETKIDPPELIKLRRADSLN